MKTEKEVRERLAAMEIILEGSDFADVTPRFKRELYLKSEALEWVLGINKNENN